MPPSTISHAMASRIRPEKRSKMRTARRLSASDRKLAASSTSSTPTEAMTTAVSVATGRPINTPGSSSASVIAAVIEAGPAISGMTRGTQRWSSVSPGLRCTPVIPKPAPRSISSDARITTRPPAVRKAAKLTSISERMRAPPTAATLRTMSTPKATFTEARRICGREKPSVAAKKNGSSASGLVSAMSAIEA